MIDCRSKSDKESRGFAVYVTVPGVVTHKVPFIATSAFHGEYNFNIHGLHFIDASEEFIKWNKEKMVFLSIQNTVNPRYSRFGPENRGKPWITKQKQSLSLI